METLWDIRGRTVVVTGGTGGIGYEIALGLATRGATVIAIGRNTSRGVAAVSRLQQQTGNAAHAFVQSDLSDLSDVCRLAQHIATHFPHVQVLVNNAAAQFVEREETVDGLEATLVTTHLSSFLLTNLLVPVLEANAPARIVYVNSTLHRRAQIHFDDLQLTMGYTGPEAYGQAKLASVLTAYELARRLKGTGVPVNVADPLGAPSTNLVKKSAISTRFLGRVLMSALSLYLTPQRAARSSLYLASSPEAADLNGKYVDHRCKVIASAPVSYDEALAKKVWQVSAELTSLEQKSINH